MLPVFSRRHAALLLLAAGLFQQTHAQQPPAQEPTQVRFIFDWAFEGSHAPYAQTLAKGYFEANGLKVKADRGAGSVDAVSKVASGAYEFGSADINVLLQHNKDNPQNAVTAVFVLYDATLNAVIGRKQSGIEKPADLVGKRIAAPAHDNARALFPLFAKATGIDPSKVQWLSVQANVRDAQLVRGDADAIAGSETARIAINNLGLANDQLTILRFNQYVPELIGRAIVVTQKTLKERPELVRAFVRAITAGTRDAVANPEEATQALTRLDNLIKVPLDLARFRVNLEQALLTPNVRANGLSNITPERARKNFTLVAEALNLPVPTDTRLYYDDRFLPPAAERQIPGR